LISDIPTPKDFFDSGIELFDFAWDTVASLITNLSQAIQMGVEEKDVSEEYWAASKRRLTSALAMTQQGVEFVLKGRIAEVSPFLLLAEGPSRWPSPVHRFRLTHSATSSEGAAPRHPLRGAFACSACEMVNTCYDRRRSMRTSKVLSVSLPAEMLRRVEEMARAEDRTMSELVREALRAYESLRAGTLPDRRATAKTPRNIGR
jgi:hypothetical protein